MKLVTLMENTACREGLAAEHGLSLYIETGAHRILFDAGQTGAFGENTRALGVDLQTVDFAVLSHGHYDHGGGMIRFLEENPTALVYLSRYAFEPHYNAKGKYIGLPPELASCSRLVFTERTHVLSSGLTLHSLCCAPADAAGLTVLEHGTLVPEDFRHEQYLMIEEGGRKILISGCSHKGILNIVDHFQPDILIGGFHFMKVEDYAVLRHAAQELLQYKTVYYTGHCTGENQYAYLKEIMGDRLHALSTGTVLEI